MSKKRDNSEIKRIKEQIEALKRQRDRIERLINIFLNYETILDYWTAQYLELSRLKLIYGGKSFVLPKPERELLEQHLGAETLKNLEENTNITNALTEKILLEGRSLIVAEMRDALLEFDKLIVDLMASIRQIEAGRKSATQLYFEGKIKVSSENVVYHSIKHVPHIIESLNEVFPKVVSFDAEVMMSM